MAGEQAAADLEAADDPAKPIGEPPGILNRVRVKCDQ